MQNRYFTLTCAVIVFGPSIISAALISPTSQSRTISASADGNYYETPPDPHPNDCRDSQRASDSAPDFGPFMSSVSAREVCRGSDATASQTSSILGTQITGLGAAEGEGKDLFLDGTGSAFAVSSMNVTFLVSEDVTYRFEGQVTAEGLIHGPISRAFVRLKGPDDNDVLFLETITGTRALMTSGTLLAGEYDLEAVAADPGSISDTLGALPTLLLTSRLSPNRRMAFFLC